MPKIPHFCKFDDPKPVSEGQKKNRGLRRVRGSLTKRKRRRMLNAGQPCPGCGVISEETEAIP